MITNIARGTNLTFTILPYDLEKPIAEALADHPSSYVLGFVTYSEESGRYTYTSAQTREVTRIHWTIDILKQDGYSEDASTWIVYTCSPEKARLEYGKIIGDYAQTLHIYNWDTWSVEDLQGQVAVVTNWERY